ncbi:MAG: sigma-70 family RNA polymerase sigma factor [Planctomycetes bacterium]|nr:sigma-70 family RNA polymerase sigma factor [Planctomycetota bacterium]
MSDPFPTLDELLHHAAWVRHLARQLATPDRADDLVQDTYLAVLEHPPPHATNPRGWLARVVTNLARSSARATTRRKRRELARPPASPSPSTDELLVELELQRKVATAVRELDEPYRTTLLLHFYRGLTPSAIATQEHLPAGTVRARLKRGLDELRARFDREHDGDRSAWSATMLAWAAPERPLLALSLTAFALVAALALLTGTGAYFLLRGESAPPSLESAQLSALPAEHATASTSPAAVAAAAPASSPTAPRAPAAPSPALTASTARFYVGSVRTDDGTPIPNAELIFAAQERATSSAPPVTGTSGADGRFRIPAGEAEPDYAGVTARAAGFAEAHFAPAVPGEELPLVLDPVTELSGTVRDATSGQPIRDAWLSLGDSLVHSDERGHWSFPAAHVGAPLSLRVRHPRYLARDEGLYLSRAEPRTLDLALDAGRALVLELVERDGGAPLANVATADGFTSDAHGRIELTVTAGQSLELDLTADDLCPASWRWLVPDVAELPAVRLPLVRRAWIEGRVHDGSGNGLARVGVYVNAEEHTNSGTHAALPPPSVGKLEFSEALNSGNTRTDADGRFRIAVVPAETPYVLEASREDLGSVERAGLLLTSSTVRLELDLVLGAGAFVRGRVLENGVPYLWANVSCYDSSGEFAGRAVIRADGSYQLGGLPAGEAELFLEEDDGERFATRLHLEAGQRYEHDFRWETELLPITGRVLDSAGNTLAGAFVQAFPSGERAGRSAWASSDAEGSFALRVPPGRSYVVEAQEDRHSRWSPPLTVEPGAHDLELVLPDLGVLRLALLDADTHHPVRLQRASGREIELREHADEPYQHLQEARVDLDGILELRRSVGTVDLRLAFLDDGYVPLELHGLELVPPAAVETCVVELTRGAELSLTLDPSTSSGPSPLRDHVVFLLERAQLDQVSGPYPSQDPPSNARIDGICLHLDFPQLYEQRLALDSSPLVHRTGLAPGRYSLKCFPDDFLFSPPEFELAPGHYALTLRWRAR